MSDIGITGYAAYVPRLRMDRAAIAAAHAWALPALKSAARGERAFCSWDEDTITMSVDALRACLRGSGSVSLRSLSFASTTPVFADLQNASMVALAAGLGEQLSTLDATGTLRAGTSALLRALEGNAAAGIATASSAIVAADARRAKPGSVQELHYGAGAVALRVGSEAPIARYLGSASSVSAFVDHFRSEGEPYDYQWEERWIRDEGYLKIVPAAVQRLLKSAGVDAASIDHFCLPATIGGVAAAVAKQLGIRPEALVDNFAARCGDTGTAHPLLMFAAALERATPGQKILLIGFGAGCDALLFETTAAISAYRSASPPSAALARGVTDRNYTKLLSFSGELQLDWGMRAESDMKTALTQLYRAREQVVAFMAGKCSDCGTVQFPRLAACVKCDSTAPMSAEPLADAPAKVATFTADWLMYYPAPPLHVGLVQFDNGARLVMEMVEVDPERFDVGTPLRMVYRVKDRDPLRHHQRYFWKAAPAL